MNPVRRTLLAFGVTFFCALVVFSLPRAIWNTVAHAERPPLSIYAVCVNQCRERHTHRVRELEPTSGNLRGRMQPDVEAGCR